MTIRQAIITYDSAIVARWSLQAEGPSIDWIMKCALNGRDYPRERGIISIKHVPEGSEVIVARAE